MFKLINHIEGAVNKGFLISEDYIVYQIGTKILKKALSNFSFDEFIEIQKGRNIQKFIKKDFGYVGLSSGNIFYLNQNLSIFDNDEIRFVGYEVFENRYLTQIVDFNTTTLKSVTAIYDIDEKTTRFKGKEGEMILLKMNMIFGLSNTYVSRIDTLSNKIWTFFFDNNNIYPQLLGISKSIVVFGFQSIDKIIGLYLDTGEVVWEIDTFTSGILVDSFEDVLHQMMVNYAAYDTISGNLIRNFNNSEYFKSNGIESQRDNYYCFSPHIFTTDWRNGNIGAFNTESQKFDWVYKIEGVSFPGASPVVYSHPYLTVHDKKGGLHIFERTEK